MFEKEGSLKISIFDTRSLLIHNREAAFHIFLAVIGDGTAESPKNVVTVPWFKQCWTFQLDLFIYA